jgi:RNA polymerase sigma factor (sigma-70 family)
MERVLIRMLLSMKADGETLRTRWTLVARIKDPGDVESWNAFYDRYKCLVLRVAIKAGLRPDEAEDVVQATMASVSKNIGAFEADPGPGSFTAWLLKLAGWRILDQFKKRLPAAAASHESPDATERTPTVERVADPRELDVAKVCDAERERWLMERALEELPIQVRAEAYQIFHLLTLEQKPAADVARMVGKSRAQIYVIKYRVNSVLRGILKRLEKE